MGSIHTCGFFPATLTDFFNIQLRTKALYFLIQNFQRLNLCGCYIYWWRKTRSKFVHEICLRLFEHLIADNRKREISHLFTCVFWAMTVLMRVKFSTDLLEWKSLFQRSTFVAEVPAKCCILRNIFVGLCWGSAFILCKKCLSEP